MFYLDKQGPYIIPAWGLEPWTLPSFPQSHFSHVGYPSNLTTTWCCFQNLLYRLLLAWTIQFIAKRLQTKDCEFSLFIKVWGSLLEKLKAATPLPIIIRTSNSNNTIVCVGHHFWETLIRHIYTMTDTKNSSHACSFCYLTIFFLYRAVLRDVL